MAGMTVKVDVKELTAFRKDIQKAGASAKPVFRKALNGVGLVIAAQANIKAPKGVSDPGIKGSIKHKTSTVPLQVEIGPLKGRADHAIFVEEGTKPHFPPPDALKKWCQVKLGDSRLAFVVARKISVTGTKAQPFLEPAFQENKGLVENRISQAVKVIVKMMAGK